MYRTHGFVPSDEVLAREGFKAFPPKGEPIRPGDEREKELMVGWERCAATGDREELAGEATRLARLWPGISPMAYMAAMYGYHALADDDDVPDELDWPV